ncbi:MAG: glutamate--tRNA ligase [Mycoplasmoidaceae bacterium]
MKNNLVRTRYAPSPTGLFHIGGARTALFNYIFAKAYGGSFIVRIEDTDIERNVKEGIDSQLKNLAWLKLFPDESLNNPGSHGPYIQSEKLARYRELANNLLLEDKAYRCFCKSSDLQKQREDSLKKGQTPKYSGKCRNLDVTEIQKKLLANKEFVLRLRCEEKDYIWEDLIKGTISIPSSAMSDIVILKSNGYPTYNFAVVIDDYDMEITHVLRGEEHISNTPYQIAIKEALRLDNEIHYGHLPIIIDTTGKKLSKRNLELKQFIEDYKAMGFPSRAIVNYMCLLGWSPVDNNEVFSLAQAIENFDFNALSSSPSTFDIKKMEWISKNYFQMMDEIEYIDFVSPFVNIESNLFKKNHNFCILMFKDQISYASELNTLIGDLFNIDKITKKVATEIVNDYGIDTIKTVNDFRLNIKKIEDWNVDVIKYIINVFAKESLIKGKNFYSCMRRVITLKTSGPELYKVIFLLGKENTMKYLKNFTDTLEVKKSKTVKVSVK